MVWSASGDFDQHDFGTIRPSVYAPVPAGCEAEAQLVIERLAPKVVSSALICCVKL